MLRNLFETQGVPLSFCLFVKVAFGRFPKVYPNVFPKKQGLGRGLWMLAHEEHIHNHQLRPRLRSGNKKSYDKN